MWDAIGLDVLEERIYRLLLRDPRCSVEECARRLEASPDAVQASVDRLTELGLLESSGDRYGLRAADPRIGLGGAIRRRRAELDRLTLEADELAASFQEGLLRADPERVIEVVEGSAAAGRRVGELLAGASKEVLALDAPPYAASGTSISAEGSALARGVRCRAIYSSAVLDLPAKLDEIRQMMSLGEQSRVHANLPIKLVLVDGTTALLPLTGNEEGIRFTSVVVRHSALTDALVALFETLWREAAPLAGTPSVPTLDAVDRQILELLAVGMKDEAILRHLGISERTLRRRIASLLGRLGATGRFQAGVQAARRGWI
ncbi:winged helix-turn-helix transcriptional regulator [Microtetraspora sp. AC03309]|uniref:helix-turn-helix transcriptional regulator n=1 Tax=Microtetraspora sp. AC03309 TaxID=2779376 RepID=UPI001E635476|nr:winged helix-turn-helix transcriptional regulator [Microtetraspora sp. AC03309]MCC5574073.1 winged helix-turn-helix transcriptional regulator [Microtetraspora sp. AC03309]